MRQADLVEMLRQEPFEPFRIQVSDGTTYEIDHPEFVLVRPTAAHVFFPSPDLPAPAAQDRYEVVALAHITRMIPKADTADAPSN